MLWTCLSREVVRYHLVRGCDGAHRSLFCSFDDERMHFHPFETNKLSSIKDLHFNGVECLNDVDHIKLVQFLLEHTPALHILRHSLMRPDKLSSSCPNQRHMTILDQLLIKFDC